MTRDDAFVETAHTLALLLGGTCIAVVILFVVVSIWTLGQDN